MGRARHGNELDLFGPEPGLVGLEGRRRACRLGLDWGGAVVLGEIGAFPLLEVVAVVPEAQAGLDPPAGIGRGQGVVAAHCRGGQERGRCGARNLDLDAAPDPDPLPLKSVVGFLGLGEGDSFLAVIDPAQNGPQLCRHAPHLAGRVAHRGNAGDRAACIEREGGVGCRRGLGFLASLPGAQVVHRSHLEQVRRAVPEQGAVRQRGHDVDNAVPATLGLTGISVQVEGYVPPWGLTRNW